MSREQGPHAVGRRPAANAAGRRRQDALVWLDPTEAAGMSREQGSRAPRGDATVNELPPISDNGRFGDVMQYLDRSRWV